MSVINQIPKFIVIHCSASKNGELYPIEEMRKDHIQNRGFNDVAYHLICQPNGQVDNGRPLNVVGAHTKLHNNASIGICLVGTDKFTKRQFDALRYKIDSLFLNYNIKFQDIFAHYQFDSAGAQGKTCPNITINELLVWYHLKDESVMKKYIMEEL